MRGTSRLVGALSLLVVFACAPSTAPPASAPPATVPGPAAVTGAAANAPTPPATVAMRFGLNTVTASVAPVWAAREEGFFAKYGIDAEIVSIPGGERIVGALLGGDIPITTLAPPAVVSAGLNGADLAFYAAYGSRVRGQLFVRPDIASIADLRGRRVGVTGRGGSNHRAMATLLERNGIAPDRDVIIVALGNQTESLTALLSGAVAGTLLSPPPSFRAEDEGLPMLAEAADYGIPALSGVVASRGWVARNEDLARRAVQAFTEGLAFVHLHRERTKEIIGQYTKVDDPVLLERTYAATYPVWERYPRVPLDAVRAEIEVLVPDLPAARDARPEQFVDSRFVDELDRTGFLRQLYP
jgi:ABC-type nitrate/sulfonate/bicarbonate transport system substrate-binding protein